MPETRHTIAAQPTEKTRAIGPYCRPVTLSKLDGRTREAALMRRVRAELMAHVGGNPTFPQRVLIERAVILSLRVAQIDVRILVGEPLTLHDSNFALAWNNSLRRTLIALGLEPRAAKPMDAVEYGRLLDERRAREEAAA